MMAVVDIRKVFSHLLRNFIFIELGFTCVVESTIVDIEATYTGKINCCKYYSSPNTLQGDGL